MIVQGLAKVILFHKSDIQELPTFLDPESAYCFFTSKKEQVYRKDNIQFRHKRLPLKGQL